jgi:hypothetical protein
MAGSMTFSCWCLPRKAIPRYCLPMSPTALGRDLFDFPVGLFVESVALNLAEEMERRGFKGAVSGARGPRLVSEEFTTRKLSAHMTL